MPLIRFDDILGERLEDPETARPYRQECRSLDAEVAVSRMRERGNLTQDQLAEHGGLSRNPVRG